MREMQDHYNAISLQRIDFCSPIEFIIVRLAGTLLRMLVKTNISVREMFKIP